MFCISKINRVISWTEETQSKWGLGCKAVFWPQIGSTCTRVLKGEAKGLMRQFEASSSAFLGPVSLCLRNEVVSSVCLQSSGICGPAIMRDERESERWSAVPGTGCSDLLSTDHSQDSPDPEPQTPGFAMPSSKKLNLNWLYKKGKSELRTLAYIGASARWSEHAARWNRC